MPAWATPKGADCGWSMHHRAAPPRWPALQTDDVIISINGEPIRSLPYQDIVERLRGPVGSSVQLDVFRDGDVKTFVVMRQAYR